MSTYTPAIDHAASNGPGNAYRHFIFEQYYGQGLTRGSANGKYGPQWATQVMTQVVSRLHPDLILIELDSVDAFNSDVSGFPAAVDAIMAAAGTTPVVWFDVPTYNVVGATLGGGTVATAATVAAINADLAAAQTRYPSSLWVVSSDDLNTNAFRASCPVYPGTGAVWVLQPRTNCYLDVASGNPHYNDTGYKLWGVVDQQVVSTALSGGFQTPAATLDTKIQTLLGI